MAFQVLSAFFLDPEDGEMYATTQTHRPGPDHYTTTIILGQTHISISVNEQNIDPLISVLEKQLANMREWRTLTLYNVTGGS